MAKNIHEIRCPIHVFVRMDSTERQVLDSPPFQRLRHIHQLAFTYLVYPGATHKRFEHSLGVMELAGRVFDVITKNENLNDKARKILLPETDLSYWRRVLRMAALFHDVGHLPFSHAAEKELLPEGWTHERLTWEIVICQEMKPFWDKLHLIPEHVGKLALGPRKTTELKLNVQFDNWETILSEVVVGDAFGVDRMDYLLRDAYHAGVAYGRFDHYRLIDTLRILPAPPAEAGDENDEVELGVEIGGIRTAEALLLARYFMYSQVYMHRTRRIYDIHLQNFLANWLDGGKFKTDVPAHLSMTDNEVTAAIMSAYLDKNDKNHELASRIFGRRHFKVLWQRNPQDVAKNPEAGKAIYDAAVKELGGEAVRHDRIPAKSASYDFPVVMDDGAIVSSAAISEVLNRIPPVSVDYVFVSRTELPKAQKWLASAKEKVIKELA